jgi:hypothetical protein
VIEERTAEYDAFGPWLLKVAGPEEIPPVFRNHPLDLAAAHLVIKVPRTIERRDATPAMHLYDRLLILDGAGLEVLTRSGDGFTARRIAARAVVGVEHGTELLDGRLTVHATDGEALTVPFNGASLPLVADFADGLVGLATGGPRTPGASDVLERDALGRGDVGLVTAYRALTRRWAGLRVLQSYPGRILASRDPLVPRLLRRRPRLSGAVLCSDGPHLIVQTRMEWLRFTPKPDVSERRIVIVRERVTDVESAAHPRVHGATSVVLRAGRAGVELVVPDEAVPVVH